MKKLLYPLLILLLFSLELNAQHVIGDIKISSFQQIFNPDNKKFWHPKNERGILKFRVENSEIWTDEDYSRLLLKEDGKDSATFMTQVNKKSTLWDNKILESLSEQFGEYQEVTTEHPFALGNVHVKLKKWTYNENEKSYEILFGSLGDLKGVIVKVDQ